MRALICVLFTLSLTAQEPAHPGFVRGVLLDTDTSGDSGDFSMRVTATNQVLHFTYDSRTYIESEKRRVSFTVFRKGDAIEVVSDQLAGGSLRYARTIHMVGNEPPPRPPAPPGMLRRSRSAVDSIVPRGNLTFTGVIARLSSDRLILRTRRDGEKTFVLRADTYYFEDGMLVEAATLRPNTRVFVRAGRSFDNELEIYQVIWGEILEPGRVQ